MMCNIYLWKHIRLKIINLHFNARTCLIILKASSHIVFKACLYSFSCAQCHTSLRAHSGNLILQGKHKKSPVPFHSHPCKVVVKTVNPDMGGHAHLSIIRGNISLKLTGMSTGLSRWSSLHHCCSGSGYRVWNRSTESGGGRTPHFRMLVNNVCQKQCGKLGERENGPTAQH